jgi:hypothetical protein
VSGGQIQLSDWYRTLGSFPGFLALGACTVVLALAGRGGDGLLMSGLRASGSAAAASQAAIADKAWAIKHAREVLALGNPRFAREIVREALDAFGRQADLLWLLADAELANGDVVAGRECIDEALAAGPLDPASLAGQIRILRSGGFWRQALLAVEAVPEELREDPLLRAEAGNFYRVCECPAHAVDSYGRRQGLPRSSRVARRWCWLRSGGLSGSLRQKALAFEEMSLQDLRCSSGYIVGISAVDGLDSRQSERVQAKLETNRYRFHRWWYGWFAVNRLGYRLIPLAAIPVWLILLLIVSLGSFTTGPGGVLAFAAVSAAVAVIPVILAVRTALEPVGRYRFEWSGRGMAIFLFLVVVGEALATEGYARHFLPAVGLQAAAVLGLVVAPAALACLPIAWAAAFIRHDRKFRRVIRQDPLIEAIDALLIILYELRSPRVYRGMDERLYHCRYLEYTARCLSRFLLPHSRVRYLSSSDWLGRRVAGWAEAIRHMQRQVIAPVPGGRGKVEALLVHEIRCLVTGDLGALAWREPPPPPPRRTTLRRQAVSAARAIVVAALPLAAVLGAQPFLHASPSLFDWARIATAIWALLYVLLSIDPAMREKIGAARDLADLIQTAPTPASRNVKQHHRKEP